VSLPRWGSVPSRRERHRRVQRWVEPDAHERVLPRPQLDALRDRDPETRAARFSRRGRRDVHSRPQRASAERRAARLRMCVRGRNSRRLYRLDGATRTTGQRSHRSATVRRRSLRRIVV